MKIVLKNRSLHEYIRRPLFVALDQKHIKWFIQLATAVFKQGNNNSSNMNIDKRNDEQGKERNDNHNDKEKVIIVIMLIAKRWQNKK